jgi:ABC-type Fe3+-siderophore transport system permease subunit
MSENTIATTVSLEAQRRDRRDELRLHQFEASKNANAFMTVGFKTIMLLNTGALTIIPTFIKSFNVQNIDFRYLHWGVILFVFSMCTMLFAYLFAYRSNADFALSTLLLAGSEHHKLGIEHNQEKGLEIPAEWTTEKDRRYNQYLFLETRSIQLSVWANFSYIISILIFAFAAIASIESL